MKRIRQMIFISLLLTLIGAAVAVFFVLRQPGTEPPPDIRKTFNSSDDWAPVVVVPLVLVITLGSMIPFFRIMFPAKIKNGEPARATILKVWDTGTTINDNPQIGLDLEVLTKEGRRFQAQAKTIVSRLNAALVQPGLSVDVVYDPKNMKRIQVLKIEVGEGEAGESAESRLTQIASLRDKGLISEEEYQRKREEIIRSI